MEHVLIRVQPRQTAEGLLNQTVLRRRLCVSGATLLQSCHGFSLWSVLSCLLTCVPGFWSVYRGPEDPNKTSVTPLHM